MRIERLIPPDGDPDDNQPLIRQPDGRYIGAFDLIEQQKGREASMELSILQPGDLLAMQVESKDETPNGCLFEVTQPVQVGLDIGYGGGPKNQIEGKLSGSCIPDEYANKEAVFTGCGFGGSMMQPGCIATDRYPIFHIKKVGQIQLPRVENFEVFRSVNGELVSLDPNRLDANSRELSETHESRMDGFEQIMKRFGISYDIRDFSEVHDHFHDNQEKPREFEDDEYIAQYSADMAMGNSLAVYNKKTGLWQEWKYFNWSNQDVLQVAFADLSNQEFEKVFTYGSISDGSAIHRSGEAIVTINSSTMAAFNAINYKLANWESTELLGIPVVGAHGPFNPNVQIFPNGEIRIPIDFPLTLIEDEYPGGLSKAFKRVELQSTDPVTLRIGTELRVIRSPEDELKKLLKK